MKTIKQRRLQASNACISIFDDFDEKEANQFSPAIVRAWEIGRDIKELASMNPNPAYRGDDNE